MGLAESSYSPNSVGWISNVFTAVFLPLVLIFVALRFYCRKKSKTSWGWDDVLVGIATIGQIGLAALSFDMTVNGGNGHHEAYLNSQPQTLRREGIDSFAIIVVYYAFVNIPKLAVLTLYHRLFSMHPYVILAIRLLIGVLIIQTLISVLLLLLTLRINSIDPNYLQIYTSVPNIVTDVLMLLLPMPVVWRLHVPCSVKFGIALTFLVGSLGLVFSTARFYIFYYAYVTPDDVSYMAAVQETIWTEVEPGCYLICACMLLMRPLVDRLADSFLISILRSRRSSNSYSGNSYDSPETLAGGNSIAVTGGLVLHPRSYRTPLGDKGTRMSPRGRQDDDIEMQFPNENSASGLV